MKRKQRTSKLRQPLGEADLKRWQTVKPLRESSPDKVPALGESPVMAWIRRGEEQDPDQYIEHFYRKLPLSTKYRSANIRHLKEVGDFRTAVVETFGDEGYKMVEQIYSSYGPIEYKNAVTRGFVRPDGNCTPAEIASYLCTIYDIQNFPIKITEVSDERVRIEMYGGYPVRCPYDVRPGDYRLCDATGGMEKAFTKLCNPKLRMRLGKSKAMGDDCCELIIERDPDVK